MVVNRITTMGGRAGGGARSGGGGGGMSATEKRLAEKYLGEVQNPQLKKELAAGLAAFDKEFGIPDNVTVTMRKLAGDTYGQISVHSGRIEINTMYENGGLPLSHAKHTMVHELAHSVDLSLQKTFKRKGGRLVLGVKPEYEGYAKTLQSAFKAFKSDYYSGGKAKSIGSYALTNKNEFFADAVANHLTGNKNQFTTFAYNFAKKMKSK